MSEELDNNESPAPAPAAPKQPVVLNVGFSAPRRKVQQYNPLDSGEAKPLGDSSYDVSGDGTPVGRSPLAKSTTQIPEDSFAYSSHLNAVEPPYNLEYLTILNEVSVTRQACITALAMNTVGLGFQVVKLQPSIEEDVLNTVSGQLRRKLDSWCLKDGKTFTQMLFAVKYDEETTGNGYIEVDRDRSGRIQGLYHVPAFTIRRKRDKSGWIQERPGSLASMYDKKGTPGYVEFYNYDDKYDPDTGALRPKRDPFINEIIPFQIYTARTTFYGLPRDIAALATYAGDEMARNHNVKYLTNAAVPEIALVFEVDTAAMEKMFGDQPVRIEIPDDVKLQIEEHFRYNLSAPHYQPGIFHLPMGVRLRIERLSQPNRDAGWSEYRNANKAEALRAWRTPAVIIGDAEAAQYATAAVQKYIYLEQVIEPEQRRYSEVLMNFLWPELVGIEGSSATEKGVDPEWFALKFVKMSVADKAVDATVHNVYLTTGVLDVDEVRDDIGYARRPAKPPGPEVNPIGTAAAAGGVVPTAPGLGGRGPNGTITVPAPSQPGDSDAAIRTAANVTTVGRPGYGLNPPLLGKSIGSDYEPIQKADVGDEVIDEYVDKIDALFQEQVSEWQREASLAASARVLEGESTSDGD